GALHMSVLFNDGTNHGVRRIRDSVRVASRPDGVVPEEESLNGRQTELGMTAATLCAASNRATPSAISRSHGKIAEAQLT
ncbi:hypothetical protein, partial [Streptomyces sp. NPDC127164]|uniref:hypothetical protein n=1 Tax=Streptomyces sp. NPDC127164 TaxID=3345379 RepID=UPI00362E82B9